MELVPGTVIAGRYRLDHKVGAGGMGEVWAGENVSVGVPVAIKTLLSATSVNHEIVARFKREAMFLGKIRSDYVAHVVDFIADDEVGLVLVMELVDGEPLSRILSYRSLTVEETIELGADIGTALGDLHRAHIVHRDLKPGNIIMKPIAEGKRRAVVVDFGVSRLTAKGEEGEDTLTGITRADMAVGTIEYMAPEQILNSRNVTSGSDIYALGAILFRSFAGQHIFGNLQSDTEFAQKKLMNEAPVLPMTRTDNVARGLVAIVGKATKRRPKERYATAEDLLADLIPLRDMSRAVAAAAAGAAAHVAPPVASVGSPTGPSGAITRPHAATVPLPPAITAPMAPASVPSAQQQPQPQQRPQQQPQQPQQPPPESSPQAARLSSPGAQAGSPSSPGTSVSASQAIAAIAPAPERRGVPVGVLLGAIAVALLGGAALASFFLRTPRGAVDATPAVTPTTSASAAMEPAASAETSADAPAASASAATSADAPASASAAPSASAATSADAKALEAKALDAELATSASAPKLWGKLPTAVPKNTASGAPSVAPAPSGVPTAAPTVVPTAAPKAPANVKF